MARSRTRRPAPSPEPEDFTPWPQATATWNGRDPAEIAAAHARAAQLLAGGCGSISPDRWGPGRVMQAEPLLQVRRSIRQQPARPHGNGAVPHRPGP